MIVLDLIIIKESLLYPDKKGSKNFCSNLIIETLILKDSF
jgi:hypothetical protein